MTDYDRLKTTFDSLSISYTEVVATSDNNKKLLILAPDIVQFVFNNTGDFVDYNNND